MSLNKFQTIVILLFSILILSNCLYATDTENTTNTDETNQNTEQINVKTSNELKSAMTYIKNTETQNQELNLKEGTYILSNTFNGNLDTLAHKQITINGNNSIIDGQNTRSFLSFPKYFNITMNNMTIRNMKKNSGSAIKNSGTLTLENIKFENNIGTDETDALGGGALYTEGITNITNCTFNNNGKQVKGSAISIKENELRETIVNIKNCEFYNNTSLNESIIKILGNIEVNIINCTFTNENSVNSIINNHNGRLNLENCSFTNENTPNIISTDASCTITNIHVHNNSINNIILSKNETRINNSHIYNNTLNTAITYTNNIIIENVLINNNHINDSIIINIPENNSIYELKAFNLTVFNNIANNTCGVINNYPNSIIQLENSSFINNTSLNDEGVLYDYYGKTKVINSIFINNTSEDLFKGKTDNFDSIINNIYLGNYLKTYLTSNAVSMNNILNINVSLKTDDIYNTTVTSGILEIEDEDHLLYETTVTTPTYNITLNLSGNNLEKVMLKYNGFRNFRDISHSIDVLLLKEEFSIEINNVSESFVYGDFITFDMIIKNSGNITVNNLLLSNILPKELCYINSTLEYDAQTNQLSLDTLAVNENKIIRFQTKPEHYKNLDLTFNISTNKEVETYHIIKNVKFISPELIMNKLVAHPGELINISVNINNYNKSSLASIKFIFNYKEVKNIEYTYQDNILTIQDYILDDTLTKKDYIFEIICSEDELEENFSNASFISIVKYDTHSLIDYNISNNFLNLSATILDENGNHVNSGSVLIKINGKTVKTLKVSNGIVYLENYKLTSNNENEYSLVLTFTGNNKYNLHNHDTIIKETKKNVNISIDYSIKEKIVTIKVKVNSTYGLPETGYVAVKINDKTIVPKLIIDNYYVLEYDFSDFPVINNISAVYYGNENYLLKEHVVTI